MRSLIILKGLAKSEKIRWVKRNNLDNYYLDIETIRRMYAMPELITPDKEILNKSFTDTVYSQFLEIVSIRMSRGCLLVIDVDQDSCNIYETLALIYGYTVFYVVQDIPQDYISHPLKYNPSYYITKKRSELEKELSNFLNLIFQDKIVIQCYADVLEYWNKKSKQDQYRKLLPGQTSLHISDLHSNIDLFNNIPIEVFNSDIIIFHGDYIDGPVDGGSRKLLDMALGSENKNIIWLEGNHELRLRKYLGSIILKSLDKNNLAESLLKSVNDTFLNTTALEFADIDTAQARKYLESINNKLKMFAIIVNDKNTYYCTHAGLKYKEQLDPRYIGTVVYGNRDMNRFDKGFSEIGTKNNIWSIHAHCKYPDSWDPTRYKNVINIDPSSENEVVYATQQNNKWKIWQLKR